MAKVRVKINSSTARAILRSAEVQGRLDREARAIASSAGSGYIAGSEVGPNRARAYVFTRTRKAIVDNARNNTLLRALGARSK